MSFQRILFAVLFTVFILYGTIETKPLQAVPSIRLMNAARPDVLMPAIGLGTGGYGNPDGSGGEYWGPEQGFNATVAWLKTGGRRIDTASTYDALDGVGKGWVASGVPRSEIFITSKIEISDYNGALQQFEAMMKSLQTAYVDLLLIHWPGGFDGDPIPSCKQGQPTWAQCRVQSWRALETIFNQSRARAIGVSNFEVNHLLDILDLNSSIPSVNQVEYHPYWHEELLVDFCQKHNITFNSYSAVSCPDHATWLGPKWNPIPDIRKNPVVTAIAQKHNKTPAQVILRWHWQQNLVFNARTRDPAHMMENLNVFDFELNNEDMMTLFYINHPMSKICPDPRMML